MGNVVVAIRPASSTGGASGLTRYIAESKRNPEKEGLKEKEARPLFSTNEDSLTYWQANLKLGAATGGEPKKGDLIHLVISLQKEDFQELGESREEQLLGFKDIIREAANQIEKELELKELCWVAGIHLNTDNPHAHLAISREGVDRTYGQRRRIKHLPRPLLPHNAKLAETERTFLPGKIAETVSNGIEKRRHLIRENLLTLDREPQLSLAPTATLDEAIRNLSGIQSDPNKDQIDNSSIHISHQKLAQASTLIEPRVIRSSPNHSTESRDRFTHYQQTPYALDQDPPSTHTSLSHEPQETQFHPYERDQAELLEKPQNVNEHLWRDRYILGRSMVARGEVDRLKSDLDSTKQHGDKRRFRVFDASHRRTRQISEFDIRRRADASATSTIRQAQILNPDQRHQARQSCFDSELQRHEKGIRDHQIIVAKTIAKLETQLAAATKEHAELKPRVHQLQLHYKTRGEPLPVPLLKPSEITKLQDQAITARNPARIITLERIRQTLAGERGDRSRSDQEIARLDAQLLVARSEQAARTERAHQFERSRHQTRWEINGEKYSLTDLDRRISQQENRSRLFGTPLKVSTLHLRPSSRREAAAQVKKLKEIREIVIAKIEDRRQELSTAVSEANRMTSVLSTIHVKEQDHQLNYDGERLEKVLTRSEINQLIDHGNILSDPAMLQQAFLLEARFEDRMLPDKKPTLNTRAARALGRETLSEIALRQATERLAAFQERRQFTPVAIKDLEGHEQTARLFDFRSSRHPIIWLAERITESKQHRNLRQETVKAIDSESARLKEDLANATQCYDLTKTRGDAFREQLLQTGQPLPDAAFTPKQIVQLEIYAARHPDPVERLRVETIVDRAELADQVQTNLKHSTRLPEPLQALPAIHPLVIDIADPQQTYPADPSPTIASPNHNLNPDKASSLNNSPIPSNSQTKADSQLNPVDLSRETPDIDLLH